MKYFSAFENLNTNFFVLINLFLLYQTKKLLKMTYFAGSL